MKCPIHKTEMVYHGETKQYTCQDASCPHAKGLSPAVMRAMTRFQRELNRRPGLVDRDQRYRARFCPPTP